MALHTQVAFLTVPELTCSIAKTKLLGDAHLFSRSFKNDEGEQIITLVHSEGREKEVHHLVQEWYGIIERALLPSDRGAYERLEEALKELNGLLKGTLISEHIREVHAVIALFDRGNTLHVAQAGRAEAYLTRGGSTVQITEGGDTSGHAQFLHIASGELQGGDAVILSTERLLRSMTPVQITQAQRRRGETLDSIRDVLDGEKEVAALALLTLKESGRQPSLVPPSASPALRRREAAGSILAKITRASRTGFLQRTKARLPPWRGGAVLAQAQHTLATARKNARTAIVRFTEDLQHPTRKRQAHLLLLAAAIVVFIGIWAGFQLTVNSMRHQTRLDLQKLVEKIEGDLKMVENRHLMGDSEAANAILARAEQEARNVMQHESGLFRTDALELLDRIRAKREAINNIVRLTPTVAANLSARNPDVSARGLIGIERGRFLAYDRQNLYSIIVNAVDEPKLLDGENLILDSAPFERFKTQVFLTKENRLIELIDGQPTAMKTDDPGGWLTGPDIETFLRFLYILSPQNNQILKYERLSNRYSAPSEYNVNGNLEGAIDMTIDSDVYVLHQGGKVTKLLRGEEKPFVVRNIPEGALKGAVKILKPSEKGNLYFLDPEDKRIIVTRSDDTSGESLYIRQFVLEGEQVGILQDFYVDSEETQLFVLDEKRLYSISLQQG